MATDNNQNHLINSIKKNTKTIMQLFPDIVVICYLEFFAHTGACLITTNWNDTINLQFSYINDCMQKKIQSLDSFPRQECPDIPHQTKQKSQTSPDQTKITKINMQLPFISRCMQKINTITVIFPQILVICCCRAPWEYP